MNCEIAIEALMSSNDFTGWIRSEGWRSAAKSAVDIIAALTDEQPQKVEEVEILGWPIDKPLAMFETVAEALRAEGQISRADCMTYLIERCRLAEQTPEPIRAVVNRVMVLDAVRGYSTHDGIEIADLIDNEIVDAICALQLHAIEIDRSAISKQAIELAMVKRVGFKHSNPITKAIPALAEAVYALQLAPQPSTEIEYQTKCLANIFMALQNLDLAKNAGTEHSLSEAHEEIKKCLLGAISDIQEAKHGQ